MRKGNSSKTLLRLSSALAAALACHSLAAGLRADAGFDFSANRDDLVSLDASASRGAEAFTWTQIPGGTEINLTGTNTSRPFFIAPEVPPGGETLTFLLTASSGGSVSSDIVNITIVNRNHSPVADAGADRFVAEGTKVTLRGGDSFDADSDPLSYEWVQLSGPAVVLSGGDSASPSFLAPRDAAAGGHGLTATLVFRLRVDDSYPLDLPAAGYGFADAEDTVTIRVTKTNNPPVADAGFDLAAVENEAVTLSAAGSADPDGDRLTYSWAQEPGGTPVAITGADTATPSFVAPAADGARPLIFNLTVDDGYGGTSTDSVSVDVISRDAPPAAHAARPTIAALWPPDHRLVGVGIAGVSSAGGPATITIDSVFQNEPTSGTGGGDTAVDALIRADGTVLLRAERAGKGHGRTYFIRFTATGPGGKSHGMVEVAVPHGKNPRQSGGDSPLFDSTL